MKRIVTIAVTVLMAIPLAASAAEDIGDGVCLQTNGEYGVWNGTTADDEGCITEAEYAEMYGAEALDQPVAVNPGAEKGDPDYEPDAPTVRERLFSSMATPLVIE